MFYGNRYEVEFLDEEACIVILNLETGYETVYDYYDAEADTLWNDLQAATSNNEIDRIAEDFER